MSSGCYVVMVQEATPEERKKIVPRVVIVGGKAASAYYMAKKIVKLVNAVGQKVPMPCVPRTAFHSVPWAAQREQAPKL